MSRRGWVVAFSGMGLNLALGVLYAWSVFGKQLTETVDKGGFGWSKTEAALPYTVGIAFFAGMMSRLAVFRINSDPDRFNLWRSFNGDWTDRCQFWPHLGICFLPSSGSV